MGWGCWSRCPSKKGEEMDGPQPGTPAQASARSTYLVGRPTPMPSAGGSSVGADGCGLSLAPGALCRVPNLCVHRRIRGLARGGAGGGASSEPQRGSQGGQPGRRLGCSPGKLERWQRHRRGQGQRMGPGATGRRGHKRSRERWGHGWGNKRGEMMIKETVTEGEMGGALVLPATKP